MFRIFWALLLIKYRSATTEKYVFYGFSRRFLIGTPGLLSDSRVVLVRVYPELEAVLSTTGSMAGNTFSFWSNYVHVCASTATSAER